MSDVNPQRIALVTGAAKRIGRGIALALARQGWDVVVHYGHSTNDAAQTVADINALGRKALALQADLSNEHEVLALIGRCCEGLGLPTCIVNNASLFDYDDTTSFSSASLNEQMQVNLTAPILLARELHKALQDDQRGVIINLLDQKLFNPNPDFLSYTLSKAALHTATTLLAQALAPKLRVVGIAPGISLPSGNQTQTGFERAHTATVLGRSSTPEDIAQAVCYVAEAPAMTGTTLLIDGGQHLVPSARDIMFLAK